LENNDIPMTSLTDFLDHDLFPALYRVLDRAFPEFGFRARPQSWVASHEATTRTLPGTPRPDRVECYINTPFGFTVHGGEFVAWLAYVNGGQMPRGETFLEAVETLARKAGVPIPDGLTRGDNTNRLSTVEVESAQRQRSLLETFLLFTRIALTRPEATHVRHYLIEKRNFPAEAWDIGEFGYYPSTQAVRDHLRHHGFRDDEIGYPAAEVGERRPVGSGLLYDGRWQGRLIGAWRDVGGRIMNVWARDLTGTAEEHAKYLMLKGGSKRTPFGLHNAKGQEIIIVEGFMDALALRRVGIENVVAVGGAGLSEEQVQRLIRSRVKSVILNFDNDTAGHAATEQALQRLRRSGIRAYVVNPSRMAGTTRKEKGERGNGFLDIEEIGNSHENGRSLTTDHYSLTTAVDGEHDVKQDPDSFLREHGVEGYRALLRTATRGMLYLAERTFARHDLTTPQGKDVAFDTLIPAIEALQDEREREDSLRHCALVLGYSYEALKGLFTDYATRKRAEDVQRDLAHALQTGQRELDRGESPPLQIAQGLVGALAKLQSKVLDEPQPFSVIRLDEVTRHLPRGIPSGWGALDKLGDQFNAGELTVFGARTGHGKTTVQTNLLANWLRVPVRGGSPGKFIFYSMEEQEVRVYHRLIAVLTAASGEGWSANEVRDFLRDPNSRDTWSASPRAILRAKEQLLEWEDRLLIVHRPQWTIADIEAHARAQAEQHPIAGVMVDYLQRILVPQGEKYDRRDIEVTVVARRLKGLAETVAAPIVAAAQIGREAVRDGMRIPDRESYTSREVQKAIRSRRPKLHQLREGGSEQEADFVLGLLNYRADYEMDDEERGRQEVPPVTKLEIGILKNRYGTPGHWATLAFEGRYGLLRDAAYGELEG
jgi:DNA primase/replicative DNA helicase